MATILLTGSEGNLGTYVRASLAARHPDLRIVRVARTMREGLPEDVYIGDLRDPAFVADIFTKEKIEYVMHLAAETYTAKGFRERGYDLTSNDLFILLNVLNRSSDVRKFIYGSSSLVYESSEEPPFTEDQVGRIPPPRSSYGMTKLMGERAVEALHAQFGTPYTIWRPFNIVSPLEPHTPEGAHVFVDFYRKLFVERQQEIEIFGSGSQMRCFVWVEDIAEALAAHLDDPRTDQEVFNIGSTEAVSLRDLCALMIDIGKEQGLLPPEYEPKITGGGTFAGTDTELRIPSLAKTEHVLGWRAHTPLRECFTKFITQKSA